jgi:hypothetical protein
MGQLLGKQNTTQEGVSRVAEFLVFTPLPPPRRKGGKAWVREAAGPVVHSELSSPAPPGYSANFRVRTR